MKAASVASRYRPCSAVRTAKLLSWVSVAVGSAAFLGMIAIVPQFIGTEHAPGWSSRRAASVEIGHDRPAVVAILGDPLYMQRPVSTMTLAMPDGTTFSFAMSSVDPLDDEPVCQSITQLAQECDRPGWMPFDHPMRLFLGWSRQDIEECVGATHGRDASSSRYELWFYTRPAKGCFGHERVYVFDTTTGLMTAANCVYRYRD